MESKHFSPDVDRSAIVTAYKCQKRKKDKEGNLKNVNIKTAAADCSNFKRKENKEKCLLRCWEVKGSRRWNAMFYLHIFGESLCDCLARTALRSSTAEVRSLRGRSRFPSWPVTTALSGGDRHVFNMWHRTVTHTQGSVCACGKRWWATPPLPSKKYVVLKHIKY